METPVLHGRPEREGDEADEDDEVDEGTAAPSDPSDLGEVAAAQLATEKGIDRETITVNSVEETTWSDSSLGCPEPGAGYAQALVPGVQVIVEAESTQYHYHGANDGELFLCEEPS